MQQEQEHPTFASKGLDLRVARPTDRVQDDPDQKADRDQKDRLHRRQQHGDDQKPRNPYRQTDRAVEVGQQDRFVPR